jgi:hypothetical protein
MLSKGENPFGVIRTRENCRAFHHSKIFANRRW